MDCYWLDRCTCLGNTKKVDMDFVEQIMQIVSQADIKDISGITPLVKSEKIYEDLQSKEDYRTLMSTMAMLFNDAKQRGLPEMGAAAIVLETYGDLLRAVVSEKIKKKFLEIGFENMQAFEIAWKASEAQRKIREAQKQLIDVEEKAKIVLDQSPIGQFKYSLMYAAEKWGTPSQIKTVKSLIKNIPVATDVK